MFATIISYHALPAAKAFLMQLLGEQKIHGLCTESESLKRVYYKGMESCSTQQINGHNIACVYNKASNSKTIVIFCHGFRGSSIGPCRFFVLAARLLAQKNITSLRFDQYGSGNSEGDFLDSSFNDWIATTKELIDTYKAEGYRIVLFGQSMGASLAIKVASETEGIDAVVAWVPDANVEEFNVPSAGYIEEAGERVGARFWEEAYKANVAQALSHVEAPALIIQCSDDEYVSSENHQAILNNGQLQHEVKMFDGYTHSSWSYDQAQDIINQSVQFIEDTLVSRV